MTQTPEQQDLSRFQLLEEHASLVENAFFLDLRQSGWQFLLHMSLVHIICSAQLFDLLTHSAVYRSILHSGLVI